jgi:hypothetical protein
MFWVSFLGRTAEASARAQWLSVRPISDIGLNRRGARNALISASAADEKTNSEPGCLNAPAGFGERNKGHWENDVGILTNPMPLQQ